MASVEGDGDRYNEFLAFLGEEFNTIDHRVRFYVVTARAGQLAGFVRIWHSPHIEEWVNDGMAVLPAYRRQGIGRELLETALSLAAERGAESVIAHIANGNAVSIRLHERLGFQRETPCYRNSYGSFRSGTGWRFRLQTGPDDRSRHNNHE